MENTLLISKTLTLLCSLQTLQMQVLGGHSAALSS